MGSDPSQMDPKLEHDQAKLRNADRQKQLVADTQKLVSLANELQSDVQKSSKDTLSMDVIRKADEIEKLAKSVRDKMKGS
jgi:nitric oxide reductase activation protein